MIKIFNSDEEKTPYKLYTDLTITYFTDKTPRIDFLVDKDVLSYTILWLYDDIGELFSIYSICAKINSEAPDAKIRLKIPYFPNARMDRTKTSADTFTLKYMCNIINDLKCEEVQVFDPHSDVLPALLNNCKTLLADDVVWYLTYCGGAYADVLFFPDAGAKEKYTRGKIARAKPIAFGVKNRDWKTREILSYDVMGADVKDKRVLIVDDICCKGDTILRAANKLKELGAREIIVYISHCENILETTELYKSGIIKQFYTTDSIFRKKLPNVEVLEFENIDYTLDGDGVY